MASLSMLALHQQQANYNSGKLAALGGAGNYITTGNNGITITTNGTTSAGTTVYYDAVQDYLITSGGVEQKQGLHVESESEWLRRRVREMCWHG